jgi:hypothetical protein
MTEGRLAAAAWPALITMGPPPMGVIGQPAVPALTEAMKSESADLYSTRADQLNQLVH